MSHSFIIFFPLLLTFLGHVTLTPNYYTIGKDLPWRGRSQSYAKKRTIKAGPGGEEIIVKTFMLGAILPNNVFMKRDYRRALSNVIKEHNQQPFTNVLVEKREFDGLSDQAQMESSVLISKSPIAFNSGADDSFQSSVKNHSNAPDGEESQVGPKAFRYELRTKEVYITAWDPEDTLDLVCQKLLPSQVSAVLFMNNEAIYSASAAASTAYLFKCLAVFGIPVVAWNADNSFIFQDSPSSSNVLQLAPTIKHQVMALLDILERYSWERFVILTTQIVGNQEMIQYARSYVWDPDSIYRKFRIIKSITFKSVDGTYLNKQLSSSSLIPARIFVLHATRDEAIKIFKVANRLKMTGHDYMWIITQPAVGNILDFSDFDKSKDYPIGIFGIHFETSPESLIEQIEIGASVYAQGMHDYLTNEDYQQVDGLKSNLSCNRAPKDSFFDNGLILQEYLRQVKLNFGGSSSKKNITFDDDGSLKSINLNVLNLNTEHQWMKIGIWNADDRLKIKDIIWPGAAHLPPKGVPEQFHLKIGASEEPPFIIIMDRSPSKDENTQHQLCSGGVLCSELSNLSQEDTLQNSQLTNCCSGYFIDTLEKLAQDLGFTYNLGYITEENAMKARRVTIRI